ncbi:MAG: hypothetical protein ACJ77N_12080 [Chloroflexota bacterium]
MRIEPPEPADTPLAVLRRTAEALRGVIELNVRLAEHEEHRADAHQRIVDAEGELGMIEMRIAALEADKGLREE